MIRNFFVVAYRNLIRNKAYSFINIGGLAVGMAIAVLIGLWVHDELTFNKSHKNYSRLVQVYQHVKFDAVKSTYDVLPIPLASELRTKYPEFEKITLSKREAVTLLSADKRLSRSGNFVEPDFISMIDLTMKSGSASSISDPNSILISETLAKDLFGKDDPMEKIITLNTDHTVKVAGVYEDFPRNSAFYETNYFGPWKLLELFNENTKNSGTAWDNNSWQIYGLLKPGVDLAQTSAKIRDIRMKLENPPNYKPEFFLFPMSKWHLYADFYDGVNIGGPITFVWLFGTIGAFVLLLACINFMNLSTARSERRAREVGIRKAIGSVRRQLILQFLSESLLVTLISFTLSIILVQLALPFFNNISNKDIHLPWSSPAFWMSCIGFSLVTGLIAGSYPALYLSSFKAIKVLKGTYRAGRFAAVPRRVLVVLQFTISVTLIISTIIVFRQINHARNRPMGYRDESLIELKVSNKEMIRHLGAMRTDLLATGSVTEMTAASSPMADEYGGVTNLSWKGKTDGTSPLFIANKVTLEFGKTVDWQLTDGRDFSTDYKLDTASMILNESAVKLMALTEPVGETVRFSDKDYHVIGVVKNLVRESPFSPVKPGFYVITKNDFAVIGIKLAGRNTGSELAAVEKVFRKFLPNNPFDFNFVSQDFGRKFQSVQLIGQLAAVFSILAILISCLGLFGMASFTAEQRTKEIGVRKVLGASMSSLWRLLTKEFVLLVLLSFLLAVPLSWYFMKGWLQNYEYRTEMSWWIFAGAGIGAVLITLLTISYQAIKAALINPVRSLRTE